MNARDLIALSNKLAENLLSVLLQKSISFNSICDSSIFQFFNTFRCERMPERLPIVIDSKNARES